MLPKLNPYRFAFEIRTVNGSVFFKTGKNFKNLPSAGNRTLGGFQETRSLDYFDLCRFLER